jgi:hypothetical protein
LEKFLTRRNLGFMQAARRQIFLVRPNQIRFSSASSRSTKYLMSALAETSNPDRTPGVWSLTTSKSEPANWKSEIAN